MRSLQVSEEVVTLITTTGFRADAFALCRKYLERQTYKGKVQWIIVHDDGKYKETEPFQSIHNHNIEITDIFAKKIWRPGINTQRNNLDEALSKIEGEYVLFWEDDDHYCVNYVEKMVALLKIFPVVGEGNAKYYNVRGKCYREMLNYSHASLCQTGFHKFQLDLVDRAINSGELYIDNVLWKLVRDEKVPHLLFNDLNLCIGIKGMPGRSGIGTGHKPTGYTPDGLGFKLKQWIGQDYDLYIPFLGRRDEETKKV